MTSIGPAFACRALRSHGFLDLAVLVAAALPFALIASARVADGQATPAMSAAADLV